MSSETKFKETEIGKIPQDWQIKELKELVTFKNGKSSPERDASYQYDVFGSNGKIGKSKEYNSNENIIVIGRVGSYCGSVYFSENKCWVTDNAIIGEKRLDTDSRFIYYLLINLDLNRKQTGSGQPLLNQSILNSIRVAAPKSKEQHVIAKILSDLDVKIELNGQMNKTLEQIGEALFKRWFVDFEFPNEEGKPYKSSGGKMIESELGEMPEGWETGSLYDLCNVIYGAPFSSDLFNKEGKGLPLIRIRDLHDYYPGFYTTEEHPKATTVKPGDIIAGMDAEFRPHIWLGSEAYLNQRLCMFKPKYSSVHKYFIFKIIKPHLEFYERSKLGTTVIHLGKTDIDKWVIKIPPNMVLENFSDLIDPLFNKIIILSQETKKLVQIRDSLLPKLMAGEIRVAK